jgi:hypothetical protein
MSNMCKGRCSNIVSHGRLYTNKRVYCSTCCVRIDMSSTIQTAGGIVRCPCCMMMVMSAVEIKGDSFAFYGLFTGGRFCRVWGDSQMNESTPISKQVSVLSKPKALILVTIVEVMQALVTLQKPAFAFLASIYSRHYPAKLLYLNDLEVECPYCSTRNSRETVSRSNTFGSSLASVFSYERSSNTKSNSFRINCQFCDRKYDIILISDHT